MSRTLLSVLLLAHLFLAACSSQGSPAGPSNLPEAEHVLLFVGNSLTYTHDLPGTVTTVARAAGLDVVSLAVAQPNFSLEDHWNQGIADVIRQVRPDVVIMQQGPSSLPQNQEYLAAWTETLTRVIREVDAEPALLMVWPSLSRALAFDDVRNSYRDAAVAVDGIFIPAGEAFRAVPRGQPGVDPFGGDGFHPSVAGTVLAAYVTVGTLFGVEASTLPAQLNAAPGGQPVILTQGQADYLQSVADSVVGSWRP